MRLLSYRRTQGDALRAGLLDGDSVIDLALAGDTIGADGYVGPSLKRLLTDGPAALEARVAEARARAAEDPTAVNALDALDVRPPITDPDKIICLGLNYREHAHEFEAEVPTEPVLFAKFRNALRASGDVVACRPGQHLDYEGELAVVIGRECRRVRAEDALDYVAGVMIFNDLTDRDLQFRTGQWLSGKMLDGFAPCGPYLVTLDEIADLQNLTITTRLNDEVVQRDSTAQMIFTVAQTLEYVSDLVTLVPGDIISTGTPSGVGFKRTPPLFLTDGDTIEVEIEGIGRVSNPIALSSDLPAITV